MRTTDYQLCECHNAMHVYANHHIAHYILNACKKKKKIQHLSVTLILGQNYKQFFFKLQFYNFTILLFTITEKCTAWRGLFSKYLMKMGDKGVLDSSPDLAAHLVHYNTQIK